MVGREAFTLSLSAVTMKCWTGRAQQHSRKRVSYLEIILQKSLLRLKFLAGTFHPNPLGQQGSGLLSFSKTWQLSHVFEKQFKSFWKSQWQVLYQYKMKQKSSLFFYDEHKPTYSTSGIWHRSCSHLLRGQILRCSVVAEATVIYLVT